MFRPRSTSFVCLLVTILFIAFVFFYDTTSTEPEESVKSNSSKTVWSITILVVIVDMEQAKDYRYALDSVDCYARIHKYNYKLIADTEYRTQCPHKDKFFRRHCVTALFLNQSDYTLFLDADIGVVNPNRRIEEFIDPRFEITFYERFYDQEIMAGSYIVRNSDWSREFLTGFANYEYRLPDSFHGTDNGALHVYIAETVLPNNKHDYDVCMEIYVVSTGYDDLFSYIACIRNVLGANEDHGKIRIIHKGKGWARDSWLTNSKWSPERDFMMHEWKQKQLRSYVESDLPLSFNRSRNQWFNPLAGKIELDKCNPGNITWYYDQNLIADKNDIDRELDKFSYEVEMDRYIALGRIPHRIKNPVEIIEEIDEELVDETIESDYIVA